MAKKERLDQLLVRQGHFESREQAQRAILAGWVKVGGAPVTKAGTPIDESATLEVIRPGPDFVSRGALKLKAALDAFGIDPEGRVALDIGASTGGFTDLLLKRGARRVYAVDVGYGQLAWSLRQDPRVAVFERTNARYLTPDQLGAGADPPTLAVIDVSFISLSKIMPAVKALLAPPAELVALIKPQFEAGREAVGKKGVVKDPSVHQRVIEAVVAAALPLGWHLWGLAASPLKGPEGNIEFLGWWRTEPPEQAPETPARVVARGHEELSG